MHFRPIVPAACTDREKVPPVIVSMVKNEELMKIYDLGSVHSIITGAAPLGLETAEQLGKLQQSWSILQAYGMIPFRICLFI